MRRLTVTTIALAMMLASVPVVASAPSIETLASEESQASLANEAPDPYDETVESFDGHEVPIRVYEAATPGPAPTLLWGHGWAGSNADSNGDGTYFADRGYNVVAMDFRGHGDARMDTQARVHSPSYEIRDVRHVIDWIAQQEFAQLEEGDNGEVESLTNRSGGDPVLGALGGSYGGGYQLLTAAHDDRLDAIAPEITWNSLPQSLAPNGAVKSTWVDALYGAGVAQANLAPFIHEGYAWATAANEFPDGELPGEPDIATPFAASSPAAYPEDIDVPTLLIQGLPDALFPLNQALANAQQIQQAGGEPVKLVTHLGGHILNSDGTLGWDEMAIGIQEGDGGDPCGSTREFVHRFYDDQLKGGAEDGIARVEMALDDGRCVRSSPVASMVMGETSRTVAESQEPIVLPQGVPVASATVQVEDKAHVASPVQWSALEIDGPRMITGIPTLSGNITIAGTEAIVYVSLVVDTGEEEQAVHDLIAPLRVEGPVNAESFSLDLAGVGAAVDEGDVVEVHFGTMHPMYGDNHNRAPGGIVLEELSLELPLLPAAS